MQQPSINKELGQEQGRKIKLMPKATLRAKRSDLLPIVCSMLRKAEQRPIGRLETKQGDVKTVPHILHPAGFPLPHVEDSRKRIRVYFGGVCVIDTTKAKLVWLNNHHPVYAFTREDLPSWYLSIASETPKEIQFIVKLGPQPERFPAITFHLAGPLIGLGFIKFEAVDAWFEEEEQIYVHPRDPYKRIDVLQSSRHVRIEINGVEIANTRCPLLLFETGEPMRIYIPRTHTRMDLWHPSSRTIASPYKGTAELYNVVLSSGETFEDIMWSYPSTTLECVTVKGMVAFFDERVDVWLDEEKQERPNDPSGPATPGPSHPPEVFKPGNDLLILQKP
ncbi:hypothetical protein JR316_0005663 [Psilocybe cubensis]|uniref:Uncharacterized protein n=2 Tax=Psilocybe cubensis TaxID=181762 RepID=A0ACB8GZF4_PSICU|nr:hypothetical protein JR316_0005663 [Psilocybe cubensis]KAH9481143.1 hypothetical protein JR316_0005663 [Psilocybe cubensis]